MLWITGHSFLCHSFCVYMYEAGKEMIYLKDIGEKNENKKKDIEVGKGTRIPVRMLCFLLPFN